MEWKVEIGDTVTWETVNGPMTGTVVKDKGNGDWLVTTTDDKVVIVNESSMKK